MVDNIKQGQAAICADIASIRASVDELAIFKENVEERLSAVETSAQHLSDSFDEQAKDIVKLKADLKLCEVANTQLKADCASLRKDHDKLELRAGTHEQHSRNECLLLD